MAEDAEVGYLDQRPRELYETDILLHLSAARDSQVARRAARARYSVSVTVTGQLAIHIEHDDTVRLFFVPHSLPGTLQIILHFLGVPLFSPTARVGIT